MAKFIALGNSSKNSHLFFHLSYMPKAKTVQGLLGSCRNSSQVPHSGQDSLPLCTSNSSTEGSLRPGRRGCSWGWQRGNSTTRQDCQPPEL